MNSKPQCLSVTSLIILQNRLPIHPTYKASFHTKLSRSKLLKARVPAIDVNSYGIWTFGSNVGIYKNLSYTPSFHLEITLVIYHNKGQVPWAKLLDYLFASIFNWILKNFQNEECMPESNLVVLLCNSNKSDMCRLSNHHPFNVSL